MCVLLRFLLLSLLLLLPSPGATNEFPSGAYGGESIQLQEEGIHRYDKAETVTMQVDTPAPPAPPPTMLAASTEARGNDGVGNAGGSIFTMDEFLHMNEDARRAQLLAREAKAVAGPPASKKMKTNNPTPLTPVAVGARSSKHTILLHEKYQALGIAQPVFTYGGGSLEGWSVSVKFPGLEGADELQGLSIERKYNSKQEAKEAVSEKALATLEELEREGRVKGDRKRKKSLAGNAVAGLDATGKEDDEPVQNYVGQLLGMFFLSLIFFSSFPAMAPVY